MEQVDDHTLQELQILSNLNREGSILNFFDKTKTSGGRDFLRNMIKNPKQTLPEVLLVQKLLKTITDNPDLWQIRVSRSYVLAAENYYSSNIAHTMSQDMFQHWLETMIFSFRSPTEFYHIQSGLIATLKFLKAFQEMISGLTGHDITIEIKSDLDFVSAFLNSSVIKSFIRTKDDALSKRSIFYLDYYFRKQHYQEFRRLLDVYYILDAYSAIAQVSKDYNLCYPEFVINGASFILKDLWHPLIINAVKNDFELNGDSAVCILTGANTSGKTTFLKSCGIVIYLAHLGWPVPASSLRLSFSHKLFTSIHLSDDLDLGYSHFYNEVIRIKRIAEALHNGEKCFVIIDELFRGTNQEDALHCSDTVLNGFSHHKNSIFLISTHLMELLENHKKDASMCFYCFKTKITGNDFENTFRIEPGIASEKVGKLIMEKVGIPELLKMRTK